MLQFRHEPVRSHLVVIEGGRARDPEMAILRLLRRTPVVLVVVATLVALAVDLVDGVPAWSHWAALGSMLVLATHALISRLHAR